MKTKEDKNTQSDQVRLTKLAAIQATDAEDFARCVSDMKKYAHLSDEDAHEVAKATRSKWMPSVLLEMGLDEGDVPVERGVEDNGFAEEYKKEEPEDEKDFEVLDKEPEIVEEVGNDFPAEDDVEKEDNGEVEDEGIAMVQISVPADKLKEVKDALNAILTDESADVESEDEMSNDEMSNDDEMPKGINEETEIHSEGRKGEAMNKEELAMRKAERRAIIAGVEEVEPKDIGLGHDTSGGGKPFKYDGDAQYQGEVKLTTKKFEGGGNSDLKDPYAPYAEQKVPTMNPDHLQLKDEVKAMEFSEKPANAADYEIDFDLIETGSTPIPSDGSGRAEHEHEAPVMSEHELNLNPIKVRIASELGDLDVEKAEQILADLLVQAGVDTEDIGKMTYAEGVELYHAIKTAAKDGEVSFNETHGTQGVDEHPEYKENKKANEKITIETEAKNAGSESVNEGERNANDLYRARLKTAYACSYKLLMAGCLSDEDEAEEYVESLLNDNLSATAMIRQSTLWLKSAQAIKSEKTAAANSGVKKTASNVGLSISPSIKVANTVDTSGPTDLADALRGMFTVTKIETGDEN